MRSGWTASNATGDLRPPGYARRRAAAAAVVVLSLTLTGAGEVVGAPNAVVGRIRTTKGQVTVARGGPLKAGADLHNGGLVVIGPTGEAELKINVKATNCTAGRNAQFRVAPSENWPCKSWARTVIRRAPPRRARIAR